MPASTDDILTAIKNIVTALNTSVQTSINLAGAQDFFNITSVAQIKTGAGRIARISVTVAGSAPGGVYDEISGGGRLLFVIPNTVGIYDVSLPFQYGLVILPGTGQTLAGSYS